ncbi:DUF5133 domain-containing protein [Streptomyces sp. NBC_01497]
MCVSTGTRDVGAALEVARQRLAEAAQVTRDAVAA